MRASATASEAELIAHAVADLTQRTRFPVAFGGMLRDGAVHVSAVSGARTRHLDTLVVESGRGLGGRAVVETRPRLALDYRTAKSITHDYDRMVLGEGIATLFAVPIVVSGTARGVLYCGSWGQSPVAEVTAQPAVRVAGEVADELLIRDEVERRVARTHVDATTSSAREQLRETYAELRRIAADVQDIGIRERLARLQERLAPASITDFPQGAKTSLSPRETDVLACAALGSTNAEIAIALGLKETTVKSYLSSAMAKLDAATRHSAVAKARRAGILP